MNAASTGGPSGRAWPLAPSRSTHRLAALLSVLAFTGLVAGCGGDESPAGEAAGGGPPTGESVDAGERPSEVTLNELVENIQLYYDEQVTVSGEVAEVFASPGAFTLGASVSELLLLVVIAAN